MINPRLWAVNQLNETTAEILLYGDIFPTEGSVNAKEVMTKLRELESYCTLINIRLNSNGGDVFEGVTIFNALKNSKCTIHTYIDGIAASIGSVIAFAGSKIFMSKYARLMTHKPSGGAWGQAEDLRKQANLIDDAEKILNAIYMERTGLSASEVTAKFLNGNDAYFDAATALAEKLIDGIYDGEPVEVPKSITNQKGCLAAI